jgi:hypothetical protein
LRGVRGGTRRFVPVGKALELAAANLIIILLIKKIKITLLYRKINGNKIIIIV